MLDILLNNFNILAECGPFNAEEFEIISFFYKAFLFGTPAIVILLCTVDIASAVIAQDDGAIKKAQNKAVKRLIAGVIVFFIPVFLNVVLGMSYTVTDYSGKTSKLDLGKDCVTKLGN